MYILCLCFFLVSLAAKKTKTCNSTVFSLAKSLSTLYMLINCSFMVELSALCVCVLCVCTVCVCALCVCMQMWATDRQRFMQLTSVARFLLAVVEAEASCDVAPTSRSSSLLACCCAISRCCCCCCGCFWQFASSAWSTGCWTNESTNLTLTLTATCSCPLAISLSHTLLLSLCLPVCVFFAVFVYLCVSFVKGLANKGACSSSSLHDSGLGIAFVYVW